LGKREAAMKYRGSRERGNGGQRKEGMRKMEGVDEPSAMHVFAE